MNTTDFSDLVAKSSIEIIESLIGKRPSVYFSSSNDVNILNITTGYSVVEVKLTGDIESNMQFVMPVAISSYLCDVMFGGEGDSKDDMDSDDLVSVKDMVKNIFELMSTSGQESGLFQDITFNVGEALFHKTMNGLDKPAYRDVFEFAITVGDKSDKIFILMQNNFYDYLSNNKDSGDTKSGGDFKANASAAEFKNIELISDVGLPIKVRIGSKKMLLRDVINMDIGSVIELDRLVSDPLDIMVDEKVIGKGEVVVVDGNFGVQITEMIDVSDRIIQIT
jgi:flagellar motor switch protein FliN/FliY